MRAFRRKIRRICNEYLDDTAPVIETIEAEGFMRMLSRYRRFQNPDNPWPVRSTVQYARVLHNRVFDSPVRSQEHCALFHRTLDMIDQAVFDAGDIEPGPPHVSSEIEQIRRQCLEIFDEASFCFERLMECELALIVNSRFSA